jgi:hypothetical protein
MKTVFQILFLLATTVALVWSEIETKKLDLPLSIASGVSCDTIIAQSVFGGDCCALNRTQGGGCLLKVINGYCNVSSLVTIELYLNIVFGCDIICQNNTIQYNTLHYNEQQGLRGYTVYSHLFSTIFFSHYRFEEELGLWTILRCMTVVVPIVLLRNFPWKIFFLPILCRRELAFTFRVLSWGFRWSQLPWPP